MSSRNDGASGRSGKTAMEASYLSRYRSGELEKTADLFIRRLEECDLCPRKCGCNRLSETAGYCRTGRFARVSSAFRHFGEETPLVGLRGSGTIFFSWCNLRCVYCQNSPLSQQGEGFEQKPQDIANLMLALQGEGAHNINFVTPTHVLPQILEALVIACGRGFTLPLVYNTGGYDLPETIARLDGIFDIYLPDMKYSDSIKAGLYSDAPGYADVCFASVKEMHRQAGLLSTNAEGAAQKGLMVRHLVLPGGLAGSEEVFRFIATEVSPDTYVNIMDQYHPSNRAFEHEILKRRTTRTELEEAVSLACQAGLRNIEY